MATTINQRFKEAYSKVNISSNALARELGMNTRTVYNYTNTDRDPTFEFVVKFCEKFNNFSFDYIMYGVGELMPESTPKEVEPVSLFDKMESVYKDIINTLKEQLKSANERCVSLEEQNKILLSLIPKDKKEDKE